MGLYVECKVCCKKVYECHRHYRPILPADDAVGGGMGGWYHRGRGCGCNRGASRYYRYAE
ncbi:hypothetical protein M3936_04225 [Sutcliffiella horikoshii]|uniref:hypothetical protein n=1 Tax=Sutcliffiella horikoshii TaxID=79883 RepID=UPI0020410C8F|nr:hypothetical protein [Sutcliffiella horikoshii]MCM3616785.1 hypothetical protein [Sutcliffiella horikoshii]